MVFVQWWGVVGLALSFAVAYTVAAVVAVVILNRHTPGFDWRGLLATWAKLLVAAGAMGALVYGTVALAAPASALAMVPTVAAGMAVGAITYFLAVDLHPGDLRAPRAPSGRPEVRALTAAHAASDVA